MAERLCIVHRERPDLFEELAREFRAFPDVRIIYDRRIGERRKARAREANDQRRGDRRQYRSEMRLLGWMLTQREHDAAIPLTDARQV